jgi:hypothetical protein
MFCLGGLRLLHSLSKPYAMSIYSRLLRLYRTNMMKTPLEDFTTEILAGILSTCPDIGSAFSQSILKLEGEHFSFETQEHYKSPDPKYPNCRSRKRPACGNRQLMN